MSQAKKKATFAGRGNLEYRGKGRMSQSHSPASVSYLPQSNQRQGSDKEDAPGFRMQRSPCLAPGCGKVDNPYGFVKDKMKDIEGQVCSRKCNESFYEDMFARLTRGRSITKPPSRTTRERLTSTT